MHRNKGNGQYNHLIPMQRCLRTNETIDEDNRSRLPIDDVGMGYYVSSQGSIPRLGYFRTGTVRLHYILQESAR